MARAYTLKKRAEQQADTRQRIADAALDLHGSIGPALTTISMVAERAGVQRHTLYAHFPDERSLFMACSGLHAERHPLPDANAWRGIADRRELLRTGLEAIYGWYEDNAELVACVLRDAEHHALTKEMVVLRVEPQMVTYGEVLGASLSIQQRAVLRLALSFYTWRTLVRESGLTTHAAAALMVQVIEHADEV